MSADEFHAAWVAALGDLELEVVRAEELLRTGRQGSDMPPWEPPSLPGPLPFDLRERAQALLDRQLRTAQELTLAMHAAGRQAAVAGRFDPGHGVGHRPVYFDAAG